MGVARARLSHRPLQWVLKEAKVFFGFVFVFPHVLCFFLSSISPWHFLPTLELSLSLSSASSLLPPCPLRVQGQGFPSSQPWGGEVSDLAHTVWLGGLMGMASLCHSFSFCSVLCSLFGPRPGPWSQQALDNSEQQHMVAG